MIQASAEDARNLYDKPVIVRGYTTYITQVANDLMQLNDEFQIDSSGSEHKSAAEEIFAQAPLNPLEIAVKLKLCCVENTKSLDESVFRMLLSKSKI